MEFKKNISVIVFWGAAWGTVEATLGALLHAASFNMGWLLWFPIAYYFMNKVYKQTGKVESIIFLSVIAAAIKLIDLTLPIRIDKVVNPAASILLEGLAVFLTLKLMEKYNNPFKYKIIGITAASLAWRILYTAYALLLPAWMLNISPVRGFAPFLQFLLFEGLANALLIFIIMELAERINGINKDRETYLKQLFAKIQHLDILSRIDRLPLSALGLLMAAILVQWML